MQTITGGINYNFFRCVTEKVLMDGFIRAKCRQARKFFYVVSEDQILQLPATTAGQDESERNISVPRILNYHHYPLKFKQGCCIGS